MYIKVEVVAGARSESFRKISNDTFALSVKERAERNQANKRALQLIRKEFGEKNLVVKIISGHHTPHKIISIESIKA